MLPSQVIDHRFYRAVVSISLVGNCREIKLLLRGLKTAGIPDKVRAPIAVDGHLPLVLAVRLRAHLVKGTLVSRGVELGRFSDDEVGPG